MLLFEIVKKNFGGCIEIYDDEENENIKIL